jgi:hypothetical protein
MFTAKSDVKFEDVIFKGQLENISLNGALISFEDDVPVNRGDKCFLTIYPEGESQPIRIIADVAHFLRNMVGIRFIAIDSESQALLYELVKKLPEEPEYTDEESDNLKKFFANFFDSEP